MDIQKYLERLNYVGTQETSLATLRQLHRAHVSHIPFENLDIHYQQWIELDLEKFYTKIVEKKRGGFCYEQNGLFYEVLQQMGFKPFFISCSVYLQPLEKFGPYAAHVAIVVELEGKLWLVDVGFGSSFSEPLTIQLDTIQEQDGVIYLMKKVNDTEISLDRSFDDGLSLAPMYKFTLMPRLLEDFQEMCIYHQTSDESPLFQKRLCSKATAHGRITLTSHRLTTTQDGKRTEIEIQDEQDFLDKLSTYFDIQLTGKLKPEGE